MEIKDSVTFVQQYYKNQKVEKSLFNSITP